MGAWSWRCTKLGSSFEKASNQLVSPYHKGGAGSTEDWLIRQASEASFASFHNTVDPIGSRGDQGNLASGEADSQQSGSLISASA